MEIVNKTELESDKKKEAREKFLSDLQHAEATAEKIKQITISQEFTVARLSKLSSVPIKDCKQTIFFLSSFFLIHVTGERMQETYYKIVTDIPTRIKYILQQMEISKNHFVRELNYLQMLEHEFIARGAKEDPPKL